MKIKFFAILFTLNVFATNLAIANPSLLPDNYNIDTIHQDLLKGKFTCSDLIQSYIDNIKSYNINTSIHSAPLNAISMINPDALNQAQILDQQFAKDHKITGKLFCIPVIVKDNIDVVGMPTSSGSLALINNYPKVNANLVDRMLKQNAIILAKSNMDELAMGFHGISSRGGRVGNAYSSNTNPGGSSSGSAVAVSANFAPIAIGTDNSGSVRMPAAFNGIPSIRPTYNLVSLDGVFPMGNIDGVAGPMARNTSDLAIVLSVINNSNLDYDKFIKNKVIAKRIGVVEMVGKNNPWHDMSPETLKIYQSAESNLAKLGITLVKIKLPDYINDRKYNTGGTIGAVDKVLKANHASVANFNQICKSNQTVVLGSKNDCLDFVKSVAPLNSHDYKIALNNISHNSKYLNSIMDRFKLDGLLMPISTDGHATYDSNKINTWSSPISSNSGHPSITITTTLDSQNLPVAFEVVGAKNSEGTLLNLAYNYENHFYHFTPPSLDATDDLNSMSIDKLNKMFLLIGQLTFKQVLQPKKENQITPVVATTIIKKAKRQIRGY